MAYVTHYRTSPGRAACKRPLPKGSSWTREFGEVSCLNCNRRIHVAGMLALGFSAKDARP